MAPRRSARAASVKPASAAPEKPKSRVITPATTTRKRAASTTEAPPSKRSRTKAEAENDAPKANGPLAKKARATKKQDGEPPVQSVPYFNPLPTPPEKTRPPLILFVWGAGNFGQFGMGPDILNEFDKPKKNTWIESKIPENLFGEDGAALETVAAGGLHSLLVDEKGAIWTCGVNDDAALGRVTKDVPDPNNPGSFLDIDDLTSVPHALTSLHDHSFRAVRVISGDSICAAVSSTGALRVWGSFRTVEGLLGFSDGLKHQFEPVEPHLDLFHKPGDTEKVSSVAAGGNHLLVLTTHGNVYTWGAGEMGQLGRRVLERRKIHGTVPEKITLSTRNRRATVVGAGSYSSFAVDEDGEVWGWGLNSMGQIGLELDEKSPEVPRPTKIPALSPKSLDGAKITQIVGGEHHTLFLTSTGKVYACGRSNAGQLGLPDDHPAFKDREVTDCLSEPTLVSFPDDDDPVVEISAGIHNSMAVTKHGALYSWGQGTQGELGVPDVEVKTPRMIVRREGGQWAAVHVSCGGQHSLGLFRKKTV